MVMAGSAGGVARHDAFVDNLRRNIDQGQVWRDALAAVENCILFPGSFNFEV